MPDPEKPSTDTPGPAKATRCPICRKPVTKSSAVAGGKSVYPFCSERCKLIDLGRWLDGAYQIPVDEEDRDESDPTQP